ncbi:MAG: TIM barrel protein [Sporichthyaceae bacterium]
MSDPAASSRAAQQHWMQRLAGAPISWGVCEVPGWGAQLPARTVLSEMSALGLRASEFGPDGFLPDGGKARARALAAHGLTAVGGFVPVVAHRADVDPVAACAALLADFAAAGSKVAVFAAVSGNDGYEERVDLSADDWRMLCHNMDRLAAAAAGHGLKGTLHPHAGTLVERPVDVAKVLEGSSIALTLDTGHLMVGGGDPLMLARSAATRIAHVHLKDVRPDLAAQVRGGRLGYADAVRAGMYVPLGAGGARVADVVGTLEDSGYRGWYVLEQDRILSPHRDGVAAALAEIRADVTAGLNHLQDALSVRVGSGGRRGAA